MPNTDTHAPGSFTWIELAAKDQKVARDFYASLFGWTIKEAAMGPEFTYYTFQLNGRDAAAAYQISPEMASQGVPPHWGIYVAVTSADDAAAKAIAAGGKVIAPPMDVMDFGRMAVLQDPTGATISVWQANTHHGMEVTGDPGAFCWADLSTPDAATAAKFYKDVFGWDAVEGQDKSDICTSKTASSSLEGFRRRNTGIRRRLRIGWPIIRSPMWVRPRRRQSDLARRYMPGL
jgi:uncharacterized protein